MVPIVAALAGEPNMLSEVESLVRVTQNTDDAVAFASAGARILNHVIQGRSILDAVKLGATELKDPRRSNPKAEDASLAIGLERMLSQLDRTNLDIVKEVGQDCDYPNNLWSGSHLAAQLSEIAAVNGTRAFMLGTRQTIAAGGDSGSRNNFVGALLGAAAGEHALPQAWRSKYLHYHQVFDDAQKLLHAERGSSLVYM